MDKTLVDHQKNIIATYPNRDLTFNHGEGNYLIDSSGKKYLDLITGFGVNIFGHNHPYITSKISGQLNRLITLHGSFANDQRAKAAQRLCAKLGGKYQVYFGNSGTEAVEAALKFAAVITSKSNFVSFEGGYHGKSLSTLAVNGSQKYTQNFKKLIRPGSFLNFDRLKKTASTITTDTAAVIVEPIQGEGGIRLPSANLLTRLQAKTTQTNTLLIIDEIQTGLGRTGKFFAFQAHQITPDIICLGKGLGGGIPLSATLVHKKHTPKIPRGTHTSTTGGNPLACAGLRAVLDLLTAKVIANNKAIGQYFLHQLKSSLSDHKTVVDIRGLGLMIGIEFNTNPTPILKALQSNHILAAPAGNKVIRFLPPYTITKEEINHTILTLKGILN